MTSVLYETQGRRATITLNRPERLNAIDRTMPGLIRDAVDRANDDPAVHVIVLQGAGRAFCAGYDLKEFAEAGLGTQGVVWDPIRDYRAMKRNTDHFTSLWRSLKPTIAKVHGHAVAGGSDIALCCDLVVMAADARIGYMPARVWGCPTTAMGLVLEAVPANQLGDAVDQLAARIEGVPVNQLVMQKLMINQAFDNMGLHGTQILATLFDGITRHSPEGRWFQQLAADEGFHTAVEWRDSGRWIPEGGTALGGE